jgi:N6-L-threonylcarbamoyladenine synthase
MAITILAIESSCDETSASLIQDGKLLNNIIATQSVHHSYGGVVPELASRAHQQNIVPVVSQSLQQAGISPKELSAIAFTQGPGLLGSLLVGASFAKGMAIALKIPLIGVHHMKAHILAHFIDDPKPNFPFLCLTVSGGHTQLVKVHSPSDMEIIGQTRDDAVGEAFDKAAKLLGLPYPGGPLLDKFAQQGDPNRFTFSQTQMKDLDFSFSGIKTSILYFLKAEMAKDDQFIAKNTNDLCAGIQKTLIEMLMKKLIKAANETGIEQIAIAGGVAANSELRRRIEEEALKRKWQVFIPKFEYCTDNAGMIAMAAHFQFLEKDFTSLRDSPSARLEF